MLMMSKKFSRVVACMTTCTFGALSINCSSETAEETVMLKFTSPDGSTEVLEGTRAQVIEPLIDLAQYTADGVRTTDAAALLSARRSEFHSPSGAILVLVTAPDGALIVSEQESTVSSPYRVTWSADYLTLRIETPDGVGQVELEDVALADRPRVLGSLAASSLAMGDMTLIYGEKADFAAPIVIIVGIIFGSWLACITLGTGACAFHAWLNCQHGVKWSSMNCGVGGNPDGNWSGVGSCSFECNPPPGS
jgi:hypothetical protein